ncbi:hypothetical protein Cadr_000029801 [Camelus dromedarius]|uniref:Uncharacterized protein n=1 Tax=Camelus dromedarius TaxID=9838 RepID=A0A5N4CCN1_CAMDR|nr:hypothetical protein Cadr_000029801 [Camelus dromedarius]
MSLGCGSSAAQLIQAGSVGQVTSRDLGQLCHGLQEFCSVSPAFYSAGSSSCCLKTGSVKCASAGLNLASRPCLELPGPGQTGRKSTSADVCVTSLSDYSTPSPLVWPTRGGSIVLLLGLSDLQVPASLGWLIPANGFNGAEVFRELGVASKIHIKDHTLMNVLPDAAPPKIPCCLLSIDPVLCSSKKPSIKLTRPRGWGTGSSTVLPPTPVRLEYDHSLEHLAQVRKEEGVFEGRAAQPHQMTQTLMLSLPSPAPPRGVQPRFLQGPARKVLITRHSLPLRVSTQVPLWMWLAGSQPHSSGAEGGGQTVAWWLEACSITDTLFSDPQHKLMGFEDGVQPALHSRDERAEGGTAPSWSVEPCPRRACDAKSYIDFFNSSGALVVCLPRAAALRRERRPPCWLHPRPTLFLLCTPPHPRRPPPRKLSLEIRFGVGLLPSVTWRTMEMTREHDSLNVHNACIKQSVTLAFPQRRPTIGSGRHRRTAPISSDTTGTLAGRVWGDILPFLRSRVGLGRNRTGVYRHLSDALSTLWPFGGELPWGSSGPSQVFPPQLLLPEAKLTALCPSPLHGGASQAQGVTGALGCGETKTGPQGVNTVGLGGDRDSAAPGRQPSSEGRTTLDSGSWRIYSLINECFRKEVEASLETKQREGCCPHLTAERPALFTPDAREVLEAPGGRDLRSGPGASPLFTVGTSGPRPGVGRRMLTQPCLSLRCLAFRGLLSAPPQGFSPSFPAKLQASHVLGFWWGDSSAPRVDSLCPVGCPLAGRRGCCVRVVHGGLLRRVWGGGGRGFAGNPSRQDGRLTAPTCPRSHLMDGGGECRQETHPGLLLRPVVIGTNITGSLRRDHRERKISATCAKTEEAAGHWLLAGSSVPRWERAVPWGPGPSGWASWLGCFLAAGKVWVSPPVKLGRQGLLPVIEGRWWELRVTGGRGALRGCGGDGHVLMKTTLSRGGGGEETERRHVFKRDRNRKRWREAEGRRGISVMRLWDEEAAPPFGTGQPGPRWVPFAAPNPARFLRAAPGSQQGSEGARGPGPLNLDEQGTAQGGLCGSAGTGAVASPGCTRPCGAAPPLGALGPPGATGRVLPARPRSSVLRGQPLLPGSGPGGRRCPGRCVPPFSPSAARGARAPVQVVQATTEGLVLRFAATTALPPGGTSLVLGFQGAWDLLSDFPTKHRFLGKCEEVWPPPPQVGADPAEVESSDFCRCWCDLSLRCITAPPSAFIQRFQWRRGLTSAQPHTESTRQEVSGDVCTAGGGDRISDNSRSHSWTAKFTGYWSTECPPPTSEGHTPPTRAAFL